MIIKKNLRKVISYVVTLAMIVSVMAGLDFGVITAEAIDYNVGANDGFAVNTAGDVTAQFTISSALDKGTMQGWLLCLFSSEPSTYSNNKLNNSGDIHPYSYSNCAYYFFSPDTEKVTGTRTASWSGTATDEKGSGKTLAQVIKEENWHIVIGPRYYYAGWSGSGIGAGTNGIWENGDYYVGLASEKIGGYNNVGGSTGEDITINFASAGGTTGTMESVTLSAEAEIYTLPTPTFTADANRAFYLWDVVDENGNSVETNVSGYNMTLTGNSKTYTATAYYGYTATITGDIDDEDVTLLSEIMGTGKQLLSPEFTQKEYLAEGNALMINTTLSPAPQITATNATITLYRSDEDNGTYTYIYAATNITGPVTATVTAAEGGEEEEEDTPTGATYTFSHAYDCQRAPAFPKKGDEVTLHGFIGPYINNSSDNSAITAGWSLVSDGKYNSSTHTELSNLVDKLKRNGYSVDAADMEVYNLVRKDTDTVVATGFIFATMGSDGLLYISSNDYGYYICDKALTNTDKITVTADGDISDPAIPGGEEPPHVCEFGDWVITKEATAEADGEKERKCECGKTETAVVKFVPEADENTGILTEDTKPEDNACNADIEIDVEDIITDIGLTDEEILKIENGEDISVYLEVENADDTVDDGNKTATEDALTANMKVGMYLDINLRKKIGNNNPTDITETEQPITITFVVPDKLINTDTSKTRTYKIIRVHNGIAKVLDCSFNPATKTASFETDKFSSYAIAYVDTTIDGGNNSGSTGGNFGGNTTPTTPEKDDDKDNDYDGGDISAGASVELDETMLELGSAFESDVTVYITFTMFTLSVAYVIFKKIFKKKKHE